MIEMVDVTIRQGDFELVDLNFCIDSGQYAVLMGPTGCGKTTIMETICGLRPIRSGIISVGGKNVTSWDPALRGIGYVPQDQLLFPTMRIDRQIGYGLLVRKATAEQRRGRVKELAGLVEIEHLLDRYPRGLSGGEKQRVALARALSFRPKLLCLDEPLSALDDETRKRIADLLKTVHEQEKVTVLHITHNSQEALRIGTRLFTVQDARVEPLDHQSVGNSNPTGIKS